MSVGVFGVVPVSAVRLHSECWCATAPWCWRQLGLFSCRRSRLSAARSCVQGPPGTGVTARCARRLHQPCQRAWLHGAAAQRGRAQSQWDRRSAHLPRSTDGRSWPQRAHTAGDLHPQPATGLRESGRAHGPSGLWSASRSLARPRLLSTSTDGRLWPWRWLPIQTDAAEWPQSSDSPVIQIRRPYQIVGPGVSTAWRYVVGRTSGDDRWGQGATAVRLAANEAGKTAKSVGGLPRGAETTSVWVQRRPDDCTVHLPAATAHCHQELRLAQRPVGKQHWASDSELSHKHRLFIIASASYPLLYCIQLSRFCDCAVAMGKSILTDVKAYVVLIYCELCILYRQ